MIDEIIWMVKNIALFILTLFLCGGFAFGQKSEPVADAGFTSQVGKWFAAWELICRDVYGIKKLEPVEFVFFDDQDVYSTSKITIPEGELITGPKLLKRSFVWKKSPHRGSLTLPDKNVVPVGLMSFAAELKGEKAGSFFVMPLPDFWRQAEVKSDELGLENLVTGVFLHEFAHSQQIRNFGKQLGAFEKNNRFETEFSDDIVQNLFKKNAPYTELYVKEVRTFYEASAEKNKAAKIALIKNGIELLRKRQADFFTGKFENLKPIDEFFLTMEGLGQYTMYAWLTHERGANLPAEIVLKGVRRGGKSWSQDEGLALFLILEKFSKPKKWAKKMFGNETESVINLVSRELTEN